MIAWTWQGSTAYVCICWPSDEGFTTEHHETALKVSHFYRMRQRALRVGATAVADVLTMLRGLECGNSIHLAGHSLGCIVMSSALLHWQPHSSDGTMNGSGSCDKVDSVMLTQAAMSYYAFNHKPVDTVGASEASTTSCGPYTDFTPHLFCEVS